MSFLPYGPHRTARCGNRCSLHVPEHVPGFAAESVVAPVFAELGLRADDTIAYLCGNPEMILAAEETLLGLGLPETAVKKELYWPKGKEPRGVAGAADHAAAEDE